MTKDSTCAWVLSLWHSSSVVHVCVFRRVYFCVKETGRLSAAGDPAVLKHLYPITRGGWGVGSRGGVRTRKARPEEEDDGHIKRAAAERSRKESEGNDNACWEVKELWGILMSHLVIQTFVKWKENIKFNYARKKDRKCTKTSQLRGACWCVS